MPRWAWVQAAVSIGTSRREGRRASRPSSRRPRRPGSAAPGRTCGMATLRPPGLEVPASQAVHGGAAQLEAGHHLLRGQHFRHAASPFQRTHRRQRSCGTLWSAGSSPRPRSGTNTSSRLQTPAPTTRSKTSTTRKRHPATPSTPHRPTTTRLRPGGRRRDHQEEHQVRRTPLRGTSPRARRQGTVTDLPHQEGSRALGPR